MRDLQAENEAHRLSRKKERARLRMCFIAIKRFFLGRYGPGPYGSDEQQDVEPPPEPSALPCEFAWTARTRRDFRLELERLILLDFLMRNTDRGLDNFMIQYNPNAPPDESSIRIGAIDNSLSFPHHHPRGLRDYPYGWLYLPASLIGEPFSEETRSFFLAKLCNPLWWTETTAGLRRIFRQDPHFNERTFRNQMDLVRGQGWNIVESLRRPGEGPIELCARPKRLVKQSVHMLTLREVHQQHAVRLERTSQFIPPMKAAVPRKMIGRSTAMHGAPQSQSMPQSAAPIQRHMEDAELLAIDVVERIDRAGPGNNTADTRRNTAGPRLGTSAAHTVISLDLAGGNAPFAAEPPSPLPPLLQDMQVPVIVEHLETETRQAWLKWI